MAKTIYQLVGEYANIIGPHGPDSEQARDFRAAHADNRDLMEYADALDRIKRRLGGKENGEAERPAPAVDRPPIKDAARALWEHYFNACAGAHPYIQSIGVAENAGLIHVYLVREPHPFEKGVPAEWRGWRVQSKVVGRLAINGG